MAIAASGACRCSNPAERVRSDDRDQADCPSPEVIEGVHAIFFLIEQRIEVAAVQQQLDEVRARLQHRPIGASWTDFLRRTEWVVSLYAAGDQNARLEEEVLRAELQYSPCLDETAHAAMHERLEREWGGP